MVDDEWWMENWNNGKLEGWMDGRMEEWGNERLGKIRICNKIAL